MEIKYIQGAVPFRPQGKKSQAHNGIQPLSPLVHTTQRFQPLPFPIGIPPYHYDLINVIPDFQNIIQCRLVKL
jgi:hypothetical protein